MNTSSCIPSDSPEDINQLAAHVLGSQALAAHWLQRSAPALDGRRPSELLTTEAGVQAVRELLMRIEYGVYS